MVTKIRETNQLSSIFSIAPMLDCTDRHFRVMIRQISKKALLYSEMVVAQALYHSKKVHSLLDFDAIEHPISLQIAGDNPYLLSEATKLAKEWGYDEVNLNVGCPSARVQSGNFGACLMANPGLVAQCIESMVKASDLPVTIKHRIGIDNLDNNKLLTEFVDNISSAGAKRFTIHARKAWLNGLNPKQNRNIPPLEYERVIYLKQKRPHLKIELNGGLNNLENCSQALNIFDGVMVGRSIYEHPLEWEKIDEVIFKENPKIIKPSTIIKGVIPYAEKHLGREGRLWEISRHLVNVVQNVPGARSWRRELSQKSQKKEADICILKNAARQLEDVGL